MSIWEEVDRVEKYRYYKKLQSTYIKGLSLFQDQNVVVELFCISISNNVIISLIDVLKT